MYLYIVCNVEIYKIMRIKYFMLYIFYNINCCSN